MRRGQIRLAVFSEAQHAHRRDDRRRTGTKRQTLSAAPAIACSVSRRSNVSDARNQALAIVFEQHNCALREASYVARATRARQPHLLPAAAAPRGIEVAEPVHLGCSQKADVYAALLQQRHHGKHVAAIARTPQIRWIAHGIEQFRRGLVPDHAIFEEPNGARCMGALGDGESDHRKSHPDEHQLTVVNFTCCRRNHQFTPREKARGCAGMSSGRHNLCWKLPPGRTFQSKLPAQRLHPWLAIFAISGATWQAGGRHAVWRFGQWRSFRSSMAERIPTRRRGAPSEVPTCKTAAKSSRRRSYH